MIMICGWCVLKQGTPSMLSVYSELGADMENQRDMDLTAHMKAELADADMNALIGQIRDVFIASPNVLAALNASQIAFEVYRARQVDLVSACNDGTTALLLRDTSFFQVTKQRQDTLRNFLIDNKPDLI
jgi:uncharacterized protein YecT (DUF1311 family)